jgi:cytochrome c biogenesis protein
MSATKSNPSEKAAPQEKSFVESLQGFLASIKFAIILLVCIALGSILGTIIKQGAGPDEYLSLYSEGTYRIITLLGLNDVYHSPWFFALLFLFAINLTLCTLRRFMPILKGDKKSSIPDESAMVGMPMNFRGRGDVNDANLSSILKGYRCTYSGPEGMIFQKGSLSKYGVLLIHTSIMLILIGGFVGLVTGFKGFMVLHKGEMKNSITIGGEQPHEKPLGFSLKCKDFQVSFYPNGAPKDYVSTVEVIEGGQTIFEKQIRVNDPLNYKGIHVSQASYGKTPSLVFNIGGERVTLKERETFRKDNFVMMPIRFEQNIHNFGPGVMVVYLDQGEPRTVWFLKNIERFNEKNILTVPVRLEDVHEEFYTGLSVSKDPGVWIVWAGFAFILCGLYINFFIYFRRIYVRNSTGGYIIAGVAMKNKEVFKEEFERLRGRFNGISS